MIRVFCCFIFLMYHIFVVAQPLLNIDENKLQVEHVQYYHLGTFNAIVGVPVGRGPFPVIVYSYDEFYEWSGKDLADRIGYNLEEIAQFFAKRGYLCVIPIDRQRRINSIIGITKYLKKVPIADLDNIHLVGMSEGGFMNMIAALKYPVYKTMICIAPVLIHDKGFLSYKEFLYDRPKNPDMPVLFMFVYDTGWRINHQIKLHQLLTKQYNQVDLLRYNKEKRWFLVIDRYGDDIDKFILEDNLKELYESQNTYQPTQY